MIEDTQYEYLVKFFDGGSVKRLQTQIANMERAVERFQSKVKLANGEVAKLIDAQAVATAQGFSPNPKLDRAANSFIAGGGAQAERRNAQKRGIIARRTTEEAQIILDLHQDARRRLRKFYTALEQKQIVNLTSLSRQEFLDREVTSLKQAQVKLEAAKLRAAQAFRADLNNTDGRSTNRLRRELGQAEGDVQSIEAQVSQMRDLEKLNTRVANQQTRYNSALERANIARRDGNGLEARKELLKARQAKAATLSLRQDQLTTQELRQQVNLNRSIERSRGRINRLQAEDPFERRLRDGGAGLFKIQAQLLANYAAMGLAIQTLSFAGRFVVDLDKQFAQLQAITGTTDESMQKLEKTVIRVSEGVKFTALEVAEAATIMGQAGFSTEQISASLQNITLLATAVGTDLNTAVDLVTSTISVFNLRAEEAGTVANVFTAAVNNSKLNLDKLTLGLQYAGNIANEQNITFSELTATLGAMANSGIRSGSTLGTGLRQILTALAAPSEKLQRRLEQLGLSTDDVNVKLNGLTGVLANLQEAGFTTSDALQVLEVRAGAAYAALTNNSETIDELRTRFLLTNAAAEANSVQMEALANKGARLQSVFGTVAAKGLDPLVNLFKIFVDTLSFVLSALNKMGPVLPVLTTSIVALTTAFGLYQAKLLVTNLKLKDFTKNLLLNSVAMRANKTGLMGLVGALNPVAATITGLTLAIPLATFAFDKMTTSMDELNAKVEESKGRLDTYANNIRSIDKEIEILSQRHFDASTTMEEVNNIALELQLKFGDLGAAFKTTGGDASRLIPELERLRNVMLELSGINAAQNVIDLQDVGRRLDSQRDVFLARNSRRQTRAGGGRLGLGAEFSERFSPELRNLVRSGASQEDLFNAFDLISAQTAPLQAEVARLATEDTPEARERLRFLNDELDVFDQLVQRITSRLSNFSQQDEARRIQQDSLNAINPRVKSARAGLFDPATGFTQQLANIRASETAGPTTEEGKEQLALLAQAVSDFKDLQNKELGDLGGLKGVGLDTEVAALESQIKATMRGTDEAFKTIQGTFKLENDNRRRAIALMKSEVNSRSSLEEIAAVRARVVAELSETEKLALANKEAELDRDNIRGTKRENALAQFSASLELERERVLNSLDDLATRVSEKSDRLDFQLAEQSLEAQIAKYVKITTKQTSVAEIELNKKRALQLKDQQIELNRQRLAELYGENSREFAFRWGEMNQTLTAEREGIESSFDSLTKDLDTRRTPAIRNALKELAESIDEGKRKFDDAVDRLQEPRQALQARRAAMDVEGNADRFSNVSRARVDREIRAAEIQALRGELSLLETRGLREADQAITQLEARKSLIESDIQRQESLLANYQGGNNTTSPEEAARANREIESLRRQSLETDEEINAAAAVLEARLARIRELQREIGAVTGEAAPDTMGWMQSLNAGLQEYVNNLEKAQLKSDEFADVVVDVMGEAQDELGNAFFDILTGAKSVGDAFGDMAEAILKSILKILAEQAAIFAIKQIFGIFGFTPQTLATGGAVKAMTGRAVPRRFNRGGTIPDVGIVGRDYTPVLAEAGEFVMRKSAVDSIGKDRLYAMNAMGKQALGPEGGLKLALPEGMGGSKEVNVYVVAPEEKPQMGPDDIIHVIGQDLVTGGKTKQLVKHVMLS